MIEQRQVLKQLGGETSTVVRKLIAPWEAAERAALAEDEIKEDKKLATNLESTLSEEARVVVFANTKRRVDVCARNFAEFGTVAVHGDKQQHERERSLRSFIKGEQPLMFATDVAARGLDIKGVRCTAC